MRRRDGRKAKIPEKTRRRGGGRPQSRSSRHTTMPYLSRYTKRRSPRVLQAMGDASSILSTTLNLATDPYSQELACQISALQTIAKGGAQPICPETVDGTPDVAGIGNLVKILRYYVTAQANPWMYPAAIGVVVGVPLLLGYAFGKGSR